MSNSSLYSILDVKSGKYGPVVNFQNDYVAIRNFQELILRGDETSMLRLYPADHCLYCVGRFDYDTGITTSIPAPSLIMTGLEACTKAIAENDRRIALNKRLQGIKLQDDSALSESPIESGELPYVDITS